MNYIHKFYLAVTVMGLSGILGLLFFGSQRITSEDLYHTRINQIQDVLPEDTTVIRPLHKVANSFVCDYFQKSPEGYRYLGGLYGGVWEVGTTYSLERIKSAELKAGQKNSLLSFSLSDKSLYINIDRGDEGAVKEFLKILDQADDVAADTLVLDFRFLRTFDFGAVIRLFNQIAPRKQINLGTIVSDYQQEEIKSSGQPFFSVNYTIFMVDPTVPEPIRALIFLLNQYPGYQLTGEPGVVSDTVCLYTEYQIGPDTYRICTDKWIRTQDKDIGDQPITPSVNSSQVEKLVHMDELWYKKRDYQGLRAYIDSSLVLR